VINPAAAAAAVAACAVFQQLEVDYCIQRPRQDVWPTRAQQVPVVRMFGVNDDGECGTLLLHHPVDGWSHSCNVSQWPRQQCAKLVHHPAEVPLVVQGMNEAAAMTAFWFQKLEC
jgi:hypothetical protein